MPLIYLKDTQPINWFSVCLLSNFISTLLIGLMWFNSPIPSALSLSHILSIQVTLDVSQFLVMPSSGGSQMLFYLLESVFSFFLQLANSYPSFKTLVSSLHFLRQDILFRFIRVFLLSDSKAFCSSSFIIILKNQDPCSLQNVALWKW